MKRLGRGKSSLVLLQNLSEDCELIPEYQRKSHLTLQANNEEQWLYYTRDSRVFSQLHHSDSH